MDTYAPADPAAAGQARRQQAALDVLIGLARPAAAVPAPRLAPARPVSAPAPDARAPERERRRAGSRAAPLLGAAAIVLAAAGAWALTRWPPGRWLVYAAWLIPLAELILLAAGQAGFRARFRVAARGRFTRLIIQVTTAGRELERVSDIIGQIRGYRLSMPYEIWVVTEPGTPVSYPLADRVIVVPEAFRARSRHKARALEYSRRVRQREGLDRRDVKIIFNDDDVSLTRAYIERAFSADYDICEGVVTPRTHYAARPLGHFLASHADDVRTHACLVYCSVFQGILGRPLHVHGEGLVTTGEAERIVTWDWPVIASEDLVFGQRAAAAGLRWGWFHEYAEVTSPWTVRDFLVQRRRWLWGDLHAISHRSVMSLGAAVLVTAKYLLGTAALICSVAGLAMRLSGAIPAGSGALDYAKLSILAWAGVFFAAGWIGASSADGARTADARLVSGVLAVLMMPVSLVLIVASVAVPLVQGNPRSFAVIAKTRDAR